MSNPTRNRVLERKNIPLVKITNDIQEMSLVILGSVDTSKTTLLGVLGNPLLRTTPTDNLQSCLDDGNGYIRDLTSRLPHEKETGRTSSISYTPIFLDKDTWPELPANRAIMTSDLCGHDKYLKTTITGICTSDCDYALVCIDKVSTQINPMTIEHIKIILAMRVPFAIVISKVDITTEPELQHTLRVVSRFVKKYKKVFMVKKPSDLDIPIDYNTYVPILLTSCKTGYGILNILKLLTKIPYRPHKYEQSFTVDSTFSVFGYGTVVSGNSGINISVGDKLMLGPFNSSKNTFIEVSVRTIHDNYRNFIPQLTAGRRGCLCLRFAQKDAPMRHHIRSGMILVEKKEHMGVQVGTRYKAEIDIFNNHHTTITNGFNALCNIGSVRVCAAFKLLSKNGVNTSTDSTNSQNAQIITAARSGDHLTVELRFARPIYSVAGSRFIFREGISIGHGRLLGPV